LFSVEDRRGKEGEMGLHCASSSNYVLHLTANRCQTVIWKWFENGFKKQTNIPNIIKTYMVQI
jgi:hypothetical protein